MQKLNKNLSTEAFDWQTALEDTDATEFSNGKWLVAPAVFAAHTDATPNALGLIINPDDDLSSIEGLIQKAGIVAINFPVFADGRGFSVARLVRESLGFQGEIVAIGNFMQDQLHYLMRCGFDGFVVEDNANIESMKQSLQDFTDAYQASANNPTPLFRRRA